MLNRNNGNAAIFQWNLIHISLRNHPLTFYSIFVRYTFFPEKSLFCLMNFYKLRSFEANLP